MGAPDRNDQGGPGSRSRRGGRLGAGPRRGEAAPARRRARAPGDQVDREGRGRRDQPRSGENPAPSPEPGAGRDVERPGGGGAPGRDGGAAEPLPGTGSAADRASRAADGERRRQRRGRQGEGPAPHPARTRRHAEHDEPRGQERPLSRPRLGVRGGRSARIEYRGRRVPRDLRHGHAGADHVGDGDPPRRARSLLPARVRPAGHVRQRRADRRQQPGRRAVDRVRRVRRRLLRLLRRRRDRPDVLQRGVAQPDVRRPWRWARPSSRPRSGSCCPR